MDELVRRPRRRLCTRARSQEALSQPHVRERGLLVEADGAHQITPAIRFREQAGVPAPRRNSAPAEC
jgi:crotonobetainyl-CoA:carnitine CoA-transferase CaiB-like acyl-CoA transferase